MIKALLIMAYIGSNGIPQVDLYEYSTMKHCQEDKIKFEFFKFFTDTNGVHLECKPVSYTRTFDYDQPTHEITR